ncbi:hypothetical protein ZIOFF_038906 [Zingiber officinale]|uniref:Uncharacterized protein n=1 Tax=Zingiber officinale TaxID=94328 RepID=A0A8J5L3C4_ZINOF|nr:hypothetical protein ZIOFF_038906 [Zingiber officinale]
MKELQALQRKLGKKQSLQDLQEASCCISRLLAVSLRVPVSTQIGTFPLFENTNLAKSVGDQRKKLSSPSTQHASD